ncbi:MAG: hypothetical protein Q9219_001703 [cf. Caloplaca sp. 3 TL-2023]
MQFTLRSNIEQWARPRSAIHLESGGGIEVSGACVMTADSYLELILPARAPVLHESARISRQFSSEYPGVKYEELAVEIAMVKLSQAVLPLITGNIHLMSNPTLQSTAAIVENAQRKTSDLT